MRPRVIAKAAAALLNTGREPAQILADTQRYLETHGHGRQWRAVLRELLRLTAQSERRNTPRLLVARPEDVERLAPEISSALATLGVTLSPQVEIDPTLIGGFIVRTATHEINHSDKRHLQAIYDRVTT
jgi:hypothetical protein